MPNISFQQYECFLNSKNIVSLSYIILSKHKLLKSQFYLFYILHKSNINDFMKSEV